MITLTSDGLPAVKNIWGKSCRIAGRSAARPSWTPLASPAPTPPSGLLFDFHTYGVDPIHLIEGYELTLSHLTVGIVPMGEDTME